jgi:hypothetical protein
VAKFRVRTQIPTLSKRNFAVCGASHSGTQYASAGTYPRHRETELGSTLARGGGRVCGGSHSRCSSSGSAPRAVAPAAGDGHEDLFRIRNAALANRCNRKLSSNPTTAALAFVTALKAKALNGMAQATALRAAREFKNQKLFRLILVQEFEQEVVDGRAKKPVGFQISSFNVHMAVGNLTLTKLEGNSFIRGTITMRHEKAERQVLYISEEGEL